MPKKCPNHQSQKGLCKKPTKLQFLQILTRKISMLKTRYESTEVDRWTLLHVPSETFWSTSSAIHQIVEI